MRQRFLDKLLDHLDRLDANNLQTQFLHLARERGLMETILQAVQEGIVVLDGQRRVLYANQAAGRLLGFDAEAVLGKTMDRYLRQLEWDRLLAYDPSTWSRLMSREIEITYPEHRFLEFYVVPLAVVREGEEGAVLILRDVTREREDRAGQVESERLHAITLLAAGVAHEIGNPLNSLTIHLQLLEREIARLAEPANEHLGDLLRVAREEVGRLDGIISQFLRALRPEPPELLSEDVADILRETIDFMDGEIRNRGVWVEFEAPADLPRVRGDRRQLRQVFFNLIKNAIQAMPDGGRLRVHLTHTDRQVVIAFQDHGGGIAAEDMGRIFEPYHTTKPTGSGLGLMIVQRVIRDHGGEIEVRSQLGEGATITLYLPREDRQMRLLKSHRSRKKVES